MQRPALRSDTDPVVAANVSQVAAPGGVAASEALGAARYGTETDLGRDTKPPRAPLRGCLSLPAPPTAALAPPTATNGPPRAACHAPPTHSSANPVPLPAPPGPALPPSAPAAPRAPIGCGLATRAAAPPRRPRPFGGPSPPAGFTRWPRAAGGRLGSASAAVERLSPLRGRCKAGTGGGGR